MIAILYRAATDLAGPWLDRHLARRAALGKEDNARLGERKGETPVARPSGTLLWLHGASVGETQSLLPLIAALRQRLPALQLLVTCNTVSAATLLATSLPPGAIQQYLPLDRRAWVERFLDHWRPDAGIIADSELWPNLLLAAKARALPLALVNGRLSARSFQRWRWLRGFARKILSSFTVIAAIDETQRQRFTDLGATQVRAIGNLKAAAAMPACDEAELARFRAAIAGRPVILLASSHEPEERLVAMALAPHLTAEIAPLLLVAPRHPARGDTLLPQLRPLLALGGKLRRRSLGALPGPKDRIYLADSLGEMGLWFRLADLVIMGGALIDRGGHNPIEPALVGRAVLTGPHIGNFADLYERMAEAGGCRILPDAPSLASQAISLLGDTTARSELAAAAQRFSQTEARVLDRSLAALAPILQALDTAKAVHVTP
jgi:3-deoxy-D-manno-octulosonic-acid transferase